MNLLQLSKAMAATPMNHSVLIYGPFKAGKTRLAGTAARIPEINRIYWFDLENGIETLAHMGLQDSEMEKIVAFRIPDIKDSPVAIETMLKVFSAKSPVKICYEHGKVECLECRNVPDQPTFCLSMCTHNDLVVIDSGSQLGESALAATMKGKDVMAKPGWDEYGLQRKWLGDICSVIQQAQKTNFVVLTHETRLENDEGKDVTYPLMGNKNFSVLVGKYFGTVVYVHKKLGKHVAGSSSTYRGDVMTGSRLNVEMEKSKDPDMRQILIEGRVLKTDSATPPLAAVK